MPSVVEITSAELPGRAAREHHWRRRHRNSLTAQSLRERGHGVTLGEAAAFWKTHNCPPPHVFTNEDVKRLHAAS